MIKTFRGKLKSGGQNRIRLSTKKGKVGYSIMKFQIIPESPGVVDVELITKIFKVTQASINGDIDFSDGNLLASAFWQGGNIATESHAATIIFDQEVFNQDIFITSEDKAGSEPTNYYVELEVSGLSDNAAAVSTLRDIRLNPQVGG